MVEAGKNGFRLTSALFALVTCAALLVPACSGDSGAARTDADASVASDGDAAAPPTPGSLSVVVGAAALRTGEDGARATFTVALGSRPTQTVIVPLASSNESETKVDASALTFTPDDWDRPKTVTLIGQNDDAADGDQQVTITVGSSSSADAAYNGLRGEPIAVLNADDDTVGVEVSAPTPSANTTEAGGQALFTVRLRSRPTADVTLALGSTKPAEGMADKTALLFTTASWNQPQTVTVTGKDDTVADGDQPYAITLAKALSADPAYAAIDPPDVALVNQDDDTPGLLVSAPLPSALTTEAGGAVTFTVRLRSKPTASVTLPVSSNRTGEGTPSVTELTFTPANYDQPQPVTVTGQDDAIDDDDQAYAIVLGAAASADPLYAGIDPPDVALTNKDDDTASVLVSAPQPAAQTTEAGGKITFTIKLASQPTADVTIGISSSKPGEGQADLAQVVLTAGNWNVAQTVTVTGQDDAIDDGNVGYAIALAKATSADAKYAALDPADVALTNVDNDTAGIAVGAPLPGTTTTEGGAKVTVSVVLQSQPLADVTIPVSLSALSEATVDVAQLVFTAGNWSVAQTITVTGKDDAIDDGDQAYSLVLGLAASADGLYAVNPADVALTNLDDDTAGLVVSAPAPSNKTTEYGGQITFTVKLQSQPLADVTVPVVSTKPTEGTADKAQLVFTAATWNVAQTVTVTGQDEGLFDPDQPYSMSLGASASADPLYVNLTSSVGLLNTAAYDAVKFVGSNANITIPTAGLNIGGSDFTMEFWIAYHGSFAQVGQGDVFSTNWNLPNNLSAIMISSGSHRLGFYSIQSTNYCAFAPEIPVAINDGLLHHVAQVRSAGTEYLFLDGVLSSTTSFQWYGCTCGTWCMSSQTTAAFGSGDAAPVTLTAIRLSKSARYAGAFVPSRTWAVDANTIGQWLVSQPVQGNTLVDEAGGDNNGTIITGVNGTFL